MKSVIKKNTVTFEEGVVKRIKNTRHGMLLEMSRAVEPGHIIEVTFRPSPRQPTTSVLEVCWSDHVLQPSGPQRYLVGCRSLFSS